MEPEMSARKTKPWILALLPILLAGCADTRAGSQPAAGASMSPGMVMPPGMSMPGMPEQKGSAAAGPSQSAQLVCGAEIRADVVKMLSLIGGRAGLRPRQTG